MSSQPDAIEQRHIGERPAIDGIELVEDDEDKQEPDRVVDKAEHDLCDESKPMLHFAPYRSGCQRPTDG
jgi:hypothetical protein